MCLVAQSCLTLCNPMDCSPPRLLCPWGFSRQEYWRGLPFPSPGDLPDPGIKPGSPALQAVSLPCEPPGKPHEPLISIIGSSTGCSPAASQGGPARRRDHASGVGTLWGGGVPLTDLARMQNRAPPLETILRSAPCVQASYLHGTHKFFKRVIWALRNQSPRVSLREPLCLLDLLWAQNQEQNP